MDNIGATARPDRGDIGVGLMLDTLIVRTFVLPSLVALLGRVLVADADVAASARQARTIESP